MSYHYLSEFWLTLITDYNKTQIWNGVYVFKKEAHKEGFDQG